MREKILEASELLMKASDLLREAVKEDTVNVLKEAAEKENKSTIQIILKGNLAKDDNLSEELKKDLEEMLNDFTEKREG